MISKEINVSNKAVAYKGAVVAVAAIFAYFLTVMTYAITRSSATIYITMPGGERNSIILANGFSLAYSIAIFSLLMATLSAMAGSVTAVILKKSLLYFNPHYNFRRAILASCITALVLLIIMYFLFYSLLKDRMTFSYAETFLFWFLFPAAIFLTVCIIGGSKLNKRLDQTKTQYSDI